MKNLHKNITWLAVAFAALCGLGVPTFSKIINTSSCSTPPNYDIWTEPAGWSSTFGTKWNIEFVGKIVPAGAVPITDYATPHFRRVYQDADPGQWCHGQISFDGMTIMGVADDGGVKLYLSGVTGSEHAWYNFEIYLTDSEDETIISNSAFFGIQIED